MKGMVSDNDERRVAVIIEDDADIRNLLEAVLTQAGVETIATSNGLDGIAAVRAYDPIVTTLDVSMGNLRRKLGDSSMTPSWLETVRGVGYRLAAQE